jgi:hypothetical protein
MSLDDRNVAPAVARIDAGASNAVADSQWDPTKAGAQEDPLSESFEIVPSDASETENTSPMTSQASALKQSWSDIPGESPSMTSSTTNGMGASTSTGDGFHEVKHHHGGRGRSHGGAPRGDRGRGGPHGGHRRGGGGFRGGDRGQRGGGRSGYRPRGRGD